MKHEDKTGIASVDWAAFVASLPPSAKASFDAARRERAERNKRLLAALAENQGGLTTYDPDYSGWLDGEVHLLEGLGEALERAEMYARERKMGVVEAARSTVSG